MDHYVEPGHDNDDSDRAVQNFIDGGPPDETVIIRESCWMCHGTSHICGIDCFFCAGKGYIVGERR